MCNLNDHATKVRYENIWRVHGGRYDPSSFTRRSTVEVYLVRVSLDFVIAFPFKELNELILNKADNVLPIACFGGADSSLTTAMKVTVSRRVVEG